MTLFLHGRKRAKSSFFYKKYFSKNRKNPLCAGQVVIFLKHERGNVRLKGGRLAMRDAQGQPKQKPAKKTLQLLTIHHTINTMNSTTIDSLRPALIEARASLSIAIRDFYRNRNKNYSHSQARQVIRGKVAAYRVLCGIHTADNVRFYNYNLHDIAQAKKSLAFLAK